MAISFDQVAQVGNKKSSAWADRRSNWPSIPWTIDGNKSQSDKAEVRFTGTPRWYNLPSRQWAIDGTLWKRGDDCTSRFYKTEKDFPQRQSSRYSSGYANDSSSTIVTRSLDLHSRWCHKAVLQDGWCHKALLQQRWCHKAVLQHGWCQKAVLQHERCHRAVLQHERSHSWSRAVPQHGWRHSHGWRQKAVLHHGRCHRAVLQHGWSHSWSRAVLQHG